MQTQIRLDQIVNKTITSEIVVAYAQCPRKAYLLLCTDEQGLLHEYAHILEQRKIANQNAYLDTFRRQHPNARLYSIANLKSGSGFLISAMLQVGTYEAACGILTRVEIPSSLGEYSYEPTVFVGTHRINKDQKLALLFAGYVLEQIQGTPPVAGRIIGMGPKSHEVKLENGDKTLTFLLDDLQKWIQTTSLESPSLILNKHCLGCQFEHLCRVKAEQEDNLSLLDRVTPKVIRRYEKKGIFTVKQLSYLYKPRRRKKRTKNPPSARHKLELQALAVRTGKIYLETLPALTRQPTELFLDIEGVPDEQYYYLIGLLACEGDTYMYYPFWADTHKDEVWMWQQFVEKVNQYPNAPVYHYGSYEPRAITKLARRYETDGGDLESRLVNVNTYVYGTVYFPVRSNRLKDIGKFIGATWTSPDPSGLQSLVWRHYWDNTHDATYRDLLITYNREDCQALKLLTDELSKIKHSADTLSEVDFADQPKRRATEVGTELHNQFQTILELARADYDKKKISLRQSRTSNDEKRKRGGQKGHPGYSKAIPQADKVICVPMRTECPRHKGELLEESERTVEFTVIDLAFVESEIKKTVTKYVGKKSLCRKCHRHYNPPEVKSAYRQYVKFCVKVWSWVPWPASRCA
jgi:predicted RecB family nuclease